MKSDRLKILLLISLTIAAAVVWYSYYKATFVALSYNDAMDYASIGRNIADGKGVLSSYITPLGLVHKGLPHPDLWRAPAWPVMLAIFIKIFGATDQAVALASGFFYVASVPLIFLLARYWFGNTVAFASVILYIFSEQNLHFSISGLTEPMSLCMFVLTVFVLFMPCFRNKWGDILLGIILGVFYLTRYNALVFLPFIVVLWWLKRKPDSFLAIMRGGIALVITVLPWLLRNYRLMGSPFFSLQKYEPVMFTKTYPGYTLYTMLEKVGVLKFIVSNKAEMWNKIGQNWSDFVSGLMSPTFTGISAILFVFFIISLIFKFNEKQKGARALIVTCFAAQLAALMVIHYIPRLFFMFMPFYIIYGLALIWDIADKLFWRESVAVVLTLALASLFVISNLPDWKVKNVAEPLNKAYSKSIKEVTYGTKPSDLIISNDGHILAWYGRRSASKLPYSTAMLRELDKILPIKMIYLSGRMSWNMPEADKSWRKVFWGKPQQLYGFRLLKKMDDGSLIYVRE